MILYTRNDSRKKHKFVEHWFSSNCILQDSAYQYNDIFASIKKIKQNNITLHSQDNQNSDVLNRTYTSQSLPSLPCLLPNKEVAVFFFNLYISFLFVFYKMMTTS